MGLHTSTNPKEFFGKVLVGLPQSYGKAIALLDKGIKFDIELFAIKATHGTQGFMLATAVSTSSLFLKSGTGDKQVGDTVGKVGEFIDAVYNEVFPAGKIVEPSPGAKQKTPFMTPDQVAAAPEAIKAKAKSAAEDVDQKVATVLADKLATQIEQQVLDQALAAKAAPKGAQAKPLPGVCKLSDAQVVGQKVQGTTQGSVYRAIAMNDRVKLACKINGTGISLRVEVKDATADELVKVKQCMPWHGSYGSLHLDAGPVPVPRVLGSFIYGLGVKFDRQLQPGDEVPQ